MSWVDALKEYAKKNGKFVVPKKGSPEYDAVKKIQDGMNASRTPEQTKEVAEKKEVAKVQIAVSKKVRKETKAAAEAKKVQDAVLAKDAADAEAAKVAAQKEREMTAARIVKAAAEKEAAAAKAKQAEEYVKENPTVRMRAPKKVAGPMRRQAAPPAVEFS